VSFFWVINSIIRCTFSACTKTQNVTDNCFENRNINFITNIRNLKIFSNLTTIIFCLCFGFLWVIFAIYPPLHKILRKQKTYLTFWILSIVFPIISFLSYDENKRRNEKDIIFCSLILLIFMILYRYFNMYILKKYGRNLYLSINYNSVWRDDESDDQTTLELLFQVLLLVVPLSFSYFLSYIFIEVFHIC